MQTIPSTIAIVSDCDNTLAPDTTAQLLRQFGVEPKRFYTENAGRLNNPMRVPEILTTHFPEDLNT